MASCGICAKAIKQNQPKLLCCECKREFHGACLKMSRADIECVTSEDLPWRCQPCGEERRKSMRFESQAQEGKLTLDDIMKKMLEIAENQRKQEQSFNVSYELLSQKLEENTATVKEQNVSLEKCVGLIDTLMEENRKLNKIVADLEKRVEEIEQYSRSNSVEIHGIPIQPNEDVVGVVQSVGKALDMTVDENMIDACHRLGNRVGPNNSSPGIVVKFVRRIDKEEFLRKRRVKRNLSTRHMGLPMDQAVYVNEALTPARRRLLAATRQLKRDKNFRYLWVRGGKIFLRKEEGSAVIQVTCQADLGKL